MSKLFKYMKAYWKTIVVIVAILIVQAYCDLSLPAYTSDIVNIGIQQGGVGDRIPMKIAQEDMEKIKLFMSDENVQKVEKAYEEDLDTYDKPAYVLKKSMQDDEDQMSKLSDIMGTPMMLTSGFESESDMTNQIKDQIIEQMKSSAAAQREAAQAAMAAQGAGTDAETQAAMAAQGAGTDAAAQAAMAAQGAGTDAEAQAAMAEQAQAMANITEDTSMFDIMKMLPEEQRLQLVDKMSEQMDDMPDTIMEQAAISYVKTAYDHLGINMEKLQTNYILTTGAKMLALAFLGMLASVLVGLLASRVGASAGRDLRGQVFNKVVGFSNSEFDKFSTASLITRSTNDIQQIQLLTVMILRMVLYAPILAIGGVYRVFQTNVSMSWIIGLAVIIIVGVVAVLFTIVMPKFKILQNLVDKLNLVTREILTGLSVIRAFSTEKYEEERFDKANVNLTKTNLFVNRAMTFMMPVMMLVMNGVSVLIVWTGAHGIDEGQMQVGDMMAFIQYTMQIIMGFLMLCMISIMLPRAAVSASRVDEVLTSETIIHDPENAKKLPVSGKGVVKFDHVSFRYPGAEEDVLEDINFTAKPGETTAIIGSTGSGKSTLINLIPRFYDVTSGKVTMDGVDVRDISQHTLRDKLGYVPQKGVLFSGTIASNILYSDPDESKETMEWAADIAQATEFIDEKRKGYDSDISQGGANVSGGQKQRLSIARAIAKRPDVYIFDDSFSALDYKTDVTLRKALKEGTSDSTVIIVAQRISTILHAEQIIVLDDGKVAGIGSHRELLNSCEVYQQIALSQLSAAELKKDLEDTSILGKEDR
ncbi:ABC transporter ATP-binding protein [Hespellia stercorisuis]|uniref:ATP-binding cassette, subfamily B n=1 Tax=Hespellia stercorisuis DSM 15480 TaxID=1121950 RepID=A0A1M6QBT8_9FIRM|nr:ABC transporter ATP-binding protein [Hespellia stercorisuis]SHK17712.1 ATP-binding cassette, subfamily B [Hespellia stercorisuis DSM 15480]